MVLTFVFFRFIISFIFFLSLLCLAFKLPLDHEQETHNQFADQQLSVLISAQWMDAWRQVIHGSPSTESTGANLFT